MLTGEQNISIILRTHRQKFGLKFNRKTTYGLAIILKVFQSENKNKTEKSFKTLP
jgi:hypothetical protein